MKNLLVLLLMFAALSCVAQNNKNEDLEDTSMASIVEENDACICTKDYRPVCGNNGVTYPNACQAGCDKIRDYKEGPCEN